MANSSYLQQPQLKGEWIYFVCDDDIWKVPSSGGCAYRITTSRGKSLSPRVSPDGKWLAYLSDDHGQKDIYFVSVDGGVPQRLTYKGVRSLCHFRDANHLIFTSSFESFTERIGFAYQIDLESLEIEPLDLGPITTLDQKQGVTVLGVNCGDPAKWKNYRGGTAGRLWVQKGKKDFKQILKNLDTNLANPQIIGNRIYFISDHEGIGNIYSSSLDGRSLTQHSFQKKFYVRNFSTEENKICYQAGAEIFLLDLDSEEETLLQITTPSTFNQSQERFEETVKFLQDYNLNTDSSEVSLIARGQLFSFSPWSGASVRLGKKDTRYKRCQYSLIKPNILYAVEVSVVENKESLLIFNTKTLKTSYLPIKKDIGKIVDLKPSPDDSFLSFSNNRNDLYLYDLKKKTLSQISHSDYFFYSSMEWSPCGQFLVYSKASLKNVHELYIYDVKTKKEKLLIKSVLNDFSPSFSPDGNYLFFLGVRDFHPHYSETHFEIGFPKAIGVYGLALNKASPDLSKHLFDFEKDDSQDKENTSPKVDIDFDRLGQRIFKLPLELGGYSSLYATKEKLFFTQHQLKPTKPYQDDDEVIQEHLYTYHLKDRKKEVFDKNCLLPSFSGDKKHLLYFADGDLRLVSSENKPPEEDQINKKDGWIDLEKVKLKIDPKLEWAQMYKEAWLLQKEHFWTKEISKQVNWNRVYLNYESLLSKVHTRSEFSDLMWEMQGELRTSHCYEFGGDYYRQSQKQKNATLGATFHYDQKSKSMTITSMNLGDSWVDQFFSPLNSTSACLDIGDQILAIDGEPLEHSFSLDQALEGKTHKKVLLKIRKKDQKKTQDISVYTLLKDTFANYRDWVESNREYVHKKTKGKIGYIHLPDMYINGFSEFYRYYLRECHYKGLIIDVRYNGGGHISQHLLKILAQKPIGFDQTRYMGLEPYPMYGVNGPLVCLTNEHAGSDGDIFSHSFKLLKLGKLIGKRTWGGVVGIWPRHPLVDGTLTTQPEFSFWFKDVGFKVENYGTDPDIEVEFSPNHWAKGQDPQLDRSITEVLKELKRYKPLKIK